MKIAAGDLALYSDSEIYSAVRSGLYNKVLDTLQHWIQRASPNEYLASLILGAEEQYRKLFDRHRSGLTKLSLLGGHKRGVMSAQYSPNGSRIVSGADDNTVRV
jgi:WD40 repeat protein